MSQFRDAYDEFRRINTQVVSASVDSPYCHVAWAKQLNIPFPMLSDFARRLCESYDALSAGPPLLPNIARRTAFVIDQMGTVRYAWYPPPEGALPPVDEVLHHALQVTNVSE